MDGATADGKLGHILDLFAQMEDIVGPAAGEAIFGVAANREGKRIAEQMQNPTIHRVLSDIDLILGHESQLVSEGPPLEIFLKSPRLASGDSAFRALTIGFIEGALGHTLRLKFSSSTKLAPDGLTLHLEGS